MFAAFASEAGGSHLWPSRASRASAASGPGHGPASRVGEGDLHQPGGVAELSLDQIQRPRLGGLVGPRQAEQLQSLKGGGERRPQFVGEDGQGVPRGVRGIARFRVGTHERLRGLVRKGGDHLQAPGAVRSELRRSGVGAKGKVVARAGRRPQRDDLPAAAVADEEAEEEAVLGGGVDVDGAGHVVVLPDALLAFYPPSSWQPSGFGLLLAGSPGRRAAPRPPQRLRRGQFKRRSLGLPGALQPVARFDR